MKLKTDEKQIITYDLISEKIKFLAETFAQQEKMFSNLSISSQPLADSLEESIQTKLNQQIEIIRKIILSPVFSRHSLEDKEIVINCLESLITLTTLNNIKNS